MNRTILEKVRCMLSNAGLGKHLWAEAVSYACHLINRLPSVAIGGRTPLEVWSGKPAADYDSLHVFDCPAYYHVKESKLDPRAKKAVFVGFSSGVKGYKLLCPNSKLIMSRDVTFDETSMLKPIKHESSQKENETGGSSSKVEVDAPPVDPVRSGNTDNGSPLVTNDENTSDEEEAPTQEPPQ